jgi:lipopolysaccharide export system protein LptA
MMQPLVFALSACLCFMSSAWAEKADRDQAMSIEANRMSRDEARQLSLFSGQVLIKQGTLEIRAESLEVNQDAQGYNFAVATTKPGKWVSFRQKREGRNEFMEGFAERIEYDGKHQLLNLYRSAKVRRLVGNRVNDESMGDVIVYDSLQEIFAVKGGASVVSDLNPEGRVKTILTPVRGEEAEQDKNTKPVWQLQLRTPQGTP